MADSKYQDGRISDSMASVVIDLEMETIEDTDEKAIVQYEYPYTDGADLEDMGRKAHKIRVKCYFWDDGASHNTYDQHQKLINIVFNENDRTSSAGVKKLTLFHHPQYGLLYGKIESIVVNHSEMLRTAQVDLVFVEDGQPNIKAKTVAGGKSAVESAYVSAQTTQTKKAEASLLDKIKSYTDKVTALKSKVSSYIATISAKVSDITSPIDTLQSAITYSTDLPGIIASSLATNLEKFTLLYSSLSNYPSRYLTSLSSGLSDLVSTFESLQSSSSASATSISDDSAVGEIMVEQLKISCALRIGLEASTLVETDDAAYRNPSSYPDVQIMTLPELEESLAIARKWLNTAIDAAREMDELKTIAGALLDQVNTVRLEREKLIKVVIDPPMPLHLVCLKYGLTVADAERVLRINRNRIKNPNRTSGEILIYAR